MNPASLKRESIRPIRLIALALCAFVFGAGASAGAGAKSPPAARPPAHQTFKPNPASAKPWLSAAMTRAADVDDAAERAAIATDIARLQAEAGDFEGVKHSATMAAAAMDKIAARGGFPHVMLATRLARAQVKAGDRAGAIATLNALKKASDAGADEQRLRNASIAKAFADAGDFAAAERAIAEMPFSMTKVEAFGDLAGARLVAGDAPGSETVLAQVKEDQRDLPYFKIAMRQIVAGDLKGAATTLGRIKVDPPGSWQDLEYEKVLGKLVERDRAAADVEAVLARVPAGPTLMMARVGVALSDARRGDAAGARQQLAAAEALAAKLPKGKDSQRDALMLAMGRSLVLHEAGDDGPARDLLRQRMADAEATKDPHEKSNVLAVCVAIAGQIGSLAEATVAFDKITDRDVKQQSLQPLALAQALAGDFAGATETAKGLEKNASSYGYVLASIAFKQAQRGDLAGARATAAPVLGTPKNKAFTFYSEPCCKSLADAAVRSGKAADVRQWMKESANDPRTYCWICLGATRASLAPPAENDNWQADLP
jgi:hypothetical protein